MGKDVIFEFDVSGDDVDGIRDIGKKYVFEFNEESKGYVGKSINLKTVNVLGKAISLPTLPELPFPIPVAEYCATNDGCRIIINVFEDAGFMVRQAMKKLGLKKQRKDIEEFFSENSVNVKIKGSM